MRMAFAHTAGTAWYSGAIRWVSGGAFNHSLIIFEYDNGQQVYFESYWKKDPKTGKTGVHGPVPMAKLEAWQTFHLQSVLV